MSWAHYLLQVNIYLTVFYAFYRLLLDKETYFVMNRIYLLSAAVFSLCIPFIQLDWLMEQPVSQQLSVSVGQFEMMVLDDRAAAQQQIPWGKLIALLYTGGLLFFLLRFAMQLYLLRSIKASAVPGTAFSFFKLKSIHADLPAQQVIHKHEDIHVQQLHSLDVLFFELISILNWFNPVVHLYKASIKNIHEYLADEKAANFQGDKEQYALLLLSAAFKVSPNALTNSFYNQSLIKKRIYMLHREKSKRRAILKYGIYLPLFSGMLLLSSSTLRQNEEIMEATDKIPLENPLGIVAEAMPLMNNPETSKDGSQAGNASMQKTKLQTEWEAFYKFMAGSIKYPDQAMRFEKQGNVQTKFSIENGVVKNVAPLTTMGYGLDEEVVKSITAYKGFRNMPNGSYIITTAFRLDGTDTNVIHTSNKSIAGYTNLNLITVKGLANAKIKTVKDKNSPVDFVKVDTPPQFPGGIQAFYKFLASQIKYPDAAKKNNVQGKVVLAFIVNADGSLSDIEVIKPLLGSGTDEEAVRVLKLSPKWNPGIMNDKPVRVKFALPISFSMDAGKKNVDKSASIDQIADPNSAASLQAKLKGKVKNEIITVTANTKWQASPAVLSIVGAADPQYLINGAPASKEEVAKLNSNQIQRIDVVKGTNEPGSDNQNGEIYITTKDEGK
jgi:TonB family protein